MESILQPNKEISHRKKLLAFFQRQLRLFAFMRSASKRNYWAFKRKIYLPRKKFKIVISHPPPQEDQEEGVSITVTPEVPCKALLDDSPDPQSLVSAGQEECVEPPADLPREISIPSKSSASKIKSKLSRFLIPGIEKRNQTHANAFNENLGNFVGFGPGKTSQPTSERQKMFQSQQTSQRKQIQSGVIPQTDLKEYVRKVQKDEEQLLQNVVLSNLYQKPAESLSKMTPSELRTLYQSVLQCILFPLTTFVKPDNELQSILAEFSIDSYSVLKELFNVDDTEHNTLLSNAMQMNSYIIPFLVKQLEGIEKSNVYLKSDFKSEDDYAAWLEAHSSRFKGYLDKLKKEPSFKATLYVKVIEARDVAIKDSKTSDPFCKLKLVPINPKSKKPKNRTKHKTKTIYKTLDPVWLEEFTFELDENYHEWNLVIVMWDRDKYSSNDYMGDLEIPLSHLGNDGQRYDKWYSLHKTKNTEVSGDLHLELQLSVQQLKQLGKGEGLPAMPLSDLDYHKEYSGLLLKLIENENPDLKSGIRPLTKFSVVLLDQYAARFGIPDVYRKIIYLEILCDNFQLSKGYAKLILASLKEIDQLKKKIPITNKEEQSLGDITKKIMKQIENVISRYRTAFKAEMDGTLVLLSATSLTPQKLLVDILFHLLGEYKAKEFLEKHLRGQASHRYDLVMASSKFGAELDCAKLAAIVEFVRQGIEDDIQFYQPELPEDIRIAEITCSMFVSLIKLDIATVFAQIEKDKVVQDIFDLYYELEALSALIKKEGLQVEMIPLQPLFSPFVQKWMEQAAEKLKAWTQQVIDLDDAEKWQAILPDATGADNTILHSHSIVDLFDSLSQALQFLKKIKFDQQKNYQKFLKEVVGSIVELYAKQITLSCMADIAHHHTAVNCGELVGLVKKRQASSSSTLLNISRQTVTDLELTITKELCVRLNDIETAQNLLEDFAEYVTKYLPEGVVAKTFEKTTRFLNNTLNTLLDMITTKMNKDIKPALEIMLDRNLSEETRLEPLFAYLNIQLETLTDNLYAGIFNKLLHKLFAIVIKDLELILFPLNMQDRVDKRYEDSCIVKQSLSSICAFFSADGEGVRDGFRDKMLPVINFGCSLYEMETSDLLAFYENLKKSRHDRPIITGTHVISALFTRPRDPVAKQFIEANAVNIISHDFLKLFGLAQSREELFGKYLCTNHSCICGILYVSTNYLGFHPLIGNINNQVKILLTRITSLSKASDSNSMLVTIASQQACNQKYIFLDLPEAKQVMKSIYHRGKHLGHNINYKDESATEIKIVDNNVVTYGKVLKYSSIVREKFNLSRETVLRDYKCLYQYIPPGEYGHLLITEHYLCFVSRLSHDLCIPLESVAKIEKKKVALLFPSGLEVFTNDKKKVLMMKTHPKTEQYTFTALQRRDETHDFLVENWKKNLKPGK